MAVLLCEWWLERASLRVRQCDAPPFWHASAAPWPFWLGGVGMLLRTRDICGLPSWMFRSRSVRGWIIAWGSDTHKQFGRGSNGPPNAVQGTPPHSHLSLFVLHDGFRGFSIPRLAPCRWRPGRILIPIGKTKTTKISKTTKSASFISQGVSVSHRRRACLSGCRWSSHALPPFQLFAMAGGNRRKPANGARRANGRARPQRRARGTTSGSNSGSGSNGARSYATRVLATGVGASVPRAFGGWSNTGMHCWDAKTIAHLPLPRAVGPYTVIRATKRVNVSTIANIIGSFQKSSQAAQISGNWSSVVLVTDRIASDPIDGSNITPPTANANKFSLPLLGLGDAATLVPSAISVQIMCPTALQEASGIIYAGVMTTQAAIGGRSESWEDYMDKFVQFQNPRLLAASKLALRGVQINSYPLNMTEVSKFTQLDKDEGGSFVFDDTSYQPRGWAPIMIYNPNQASLELLITVEYRVRFDLDNPASASHTHHPVASDQTWDRLVRGAAAMGNGVADIADVVANTGMAVGRAAAVTGRLLGAARALPALAA